MNAEKVWIWTSPPILISNSSDHRIPDLLGIDGIILFISEVLLPEIYKTNIQEAKP